MTNEFILSWKTVFDFQTPMTSPIQKARNILRRDMQAILTEPGTECPHNQVTVRYAHNAEAMPAESYAYSFSEAPGGMMMQITAVDELGIVYALLHMSAMMLKVPPFWFYNDFHPATMPYAAVEAKPYLSPRYKVRYRGWFINDEVLTLGWHSDKYDPAVWEPAFETLLRCGGNMVIPGTGETHRHVERMAAEMGLYLTQHHAEPLGAEMFACVFPDKDPSYAKHPELFWQLWRAAIQNKKDAKIIWTLGFRGQGDQPFWENDPTYNTPQARGALISKIIRKQYDMLREYIPAPVCCTNLYGEIMELYQDGYISIPNQVIKIWADNGYGRMVSRRQWNHNPRVYSLPSSRDKGPHGLYYHITFHDLQASNHLTMLPNSPEFVNRELNLAFQASADEYMIVNSGNIRMHTYTLDLIRWIWRDGDTDTQKQREEFAATYFPEDARDVADCYRTYFASPVQYGTHSDEKAGEQFYHYPARSIISHWIKGNHPDTEEELLWFTGPVPFSAQVQKYGGLCHSGISAWEQAYSQAQAAETRLSRNARSFADGLLLQTWIHLTGCKGADSLCRSYEAYHQKDYVAAFLFACDAAEAYRNADEALQAAAHDKWSGFYRNDCLTNLHLTAHFCDILRQYIRMQGESSLFLDWERKYIWPDSKKNILLQTTVTAQLSEDELYAALRKNIR